MKKIISILLVLVMCFSSISAFAAPTVESLFKNTYSSFDVTNEISFTLDKPLELLDAASMLIDDVFGNKGITFSDIVDLKAMVESIFDSTQKIDIKYNVSNDFKKIDMHLSQVANTPIMINKSLTLTADSKNEMWIKLDFSNAENPEYKIIISSPASDRYMVIDYVKFFNDIGEENALASLSALYNEETMKKISEISLDTIKKNADISYKSGYLILKMNDTQAKSWIIDVIYESIKLAQIPDVSFTEEQANQLKLMLSGIQIFGKNGIEMKYKVNNKGVVIDEESKISIDVNLYDILTLAGEFDTEGLTKENSNIAFTINLKSEFSKVNKNEKVKFPTLTDENTINLLDYSNPEVIYDYDDDYVQPYEYLYIYTNEPLIENGIAYVPLRELFSELTYGEAYISWDNGTTTITSESKFFNNIKLVEGSNVVVKDGMEIILGEPVKVINGKTALSHEFIEKVLNGDFYNISNWYGSNEWEYGIDIANPDYLEE